MCPYAAISWPSHPSLRWLYRSKRSRWQKVVDFLRCGESSGIKFPEKLGSNAPIYGALVYPYGWTLTKPGELPIVACQIAQQRVCIMLETTTTMVRGVLKQGITSKYNFDGGLLQRISSDFAEWLHGKTNLANSSRVILFAPAMSHRRNVLKSTRFRFRQFEITRLAARSDSVGIMTFARW